MAKPQTIVRDGSGTRTATYQLPPGLFQYIESVLVEVDNGAAVDVRPTLQVQTVNGQVMAAKRQGEAVPAGDTGTATWALRLDDETSSGGGGGGIQFDTDPQTGDFLYIETLDTDPGTGYGQFYYNASDTFVHAENVALDADTDVTVDARNNIDLTATHGIDIRGATATIRVTNTGTGFRVNTLTSGTMLEIWNNGAIGFYGHAPVTQQGTPVTLAQVIVALQNLGLVA